MNTSTGQHIHFIAIGGAAMHNLAIALHKKGFKITGSDDEIFEPSRSRLQKYGLLPEKTGWHPENLTKDIDAVILGMHARKDNPELKAAQALGLKIYSYPAYVYEQTKNKKRVVIGGSHGKTTITSMLMHVLRKCNFTFDYLVGSTVLGFETMVNLDEESEVAILEGDEYLSSPLDPSPKFHHYMPHIAVLTGIAWDHVNVFPTMDNYKEQFGIFVDKIQDDGVLFYCEHDEHLQEIVKNNERNIDIYPYAAHPSTVEEGQTYLISDGHKHPVPFFGAHNMENVMAAKLVCQQLGISENDFYENIEDFTGAGKRLQLIAENDHSKMFMDFAHSPSKLKATIKAVKQQFKDKTLVACMELHTFSSLQLSFLNEYKDSMKDADVAVVFYNPETVQHKKLELFEPADVIKSFNDQRIKVYNHAPSLKSFLMSMDYQNKILLMMSSGNFSGFDILELKPKFQQQ